MLCIGLSAQRYDARPIPGIAFAGTRRSPGARRCPRCCRQRWSARRRCAAAWGRRTRVSLPQWRRWLQRALLHMPRWPTRLAAGAACLAWLAAGLPLQLALHQCFVVPLSAFPRSTSGQHASAWADVFMWARALLQGGDACGAAGGRAARGRRPQAAAAVAGCAPAPAAGLHRCDPTVLDMCRDSSSNGLPAFCSL